MKVFMTFYLIGVLLFICWWYTPVDFMLRTAIGCASLTWPITFDKLSWKKVFLLRHAPLLTVGTFFTAPITFLTYCSACARPMGIIWEWLWAARNTEWQYGCLFNNVYLTCFLVVALEHDILLWWHFIVVIFYCGDILLWWYFIVVTLCYSD